MSDARAIINQSKTKNTMEKLTVIGNVVRDAQVREVNGRKAINFTVAVDKSYKDKEGNKIDRAAFYNAVIWRDSNQSTGIAGYLLKGTKVYVEGKPEAKLFTTKDGKQGIDLGILVGQVELLSASKPTANNTQTADENTANIPENATVGDDLPL